MLSSHDHGNCELCDQLEAETRGLRMALAEGDALNIADGETVAQLRAALRRMIRADGHVVLCPALTPDDRDAQCEAEHRCLTIRSLLTNG